MMRKEKKHEETDEPDASTYYTVAHPEVPARLEVLYRRADELTQMPGRGLSIISYSWIPPQAEVGYLPGKT
jgi:hypothetical protein